MRARPGRGITWRAVGGALLLLSLTGTARSQSQTVTSGAGLVTPLTALGASARADALGDAFVGLSDDASALFFNSAGLSRLGSTSLSINHNTFLAGSFEETLIFGLPAGSLGGFAGAVQYVSWAGLDKRDSNGVYLGTFSDSDAALSVGWGRPISGGFAIGAALHGVQQKILDSLYTGLTGDLGLLWSHGSSLRVGLSYTGMGTSQAGFAPSRDLHMGFSSSIELGKGSSLRPLLAGDWEPQGVSRIQGGLEGTIQRACFLRVGYQAALKDNQVGGLTGFTAGAGFRVGRIQLDYAFVPFGDLGKSHRLSVGYIFPNPTPVASKPVTVLSRPTTVQASPVTVVVTPEPTPVPATGPPKSRVEVRFELPAAAETPSAGSGTALPVEPYEKAAQEHPGSALAWRNLGIVYLKLGKPELGLQCLDQALRLAPNDEALKRWLEAYRDKRPK